MVLEDLYTKKSNSNIPILEQDAFKLKMEKYSLIEDQIDIFGLISLDLENIHEKF